MARVLVYTDKKVLLSKMASAVEWPWPTGEGRDGGGGEVGEGEREARKVNEG